VCADRGEVAPRDGSGQATVEGKLSDGPRGALRELGESGPALLFLEARFNPQAGGNREERGSAAGGERRGRVVERLARGAEPSRTRADRAGEVLAEQDGGRVPFDGHECAAPVFLRGAGEGAQGMERAGRGAAQRDRREHLRGESAREMEGETAGDPVEPAGDRRDRVVGDRDREDVARERTAGFERQGLGRAALAREAAGRFEIPGEHGRELSSGAGPGARESAAGAPRPGENEREVRELVRHGGQSKGSPQLSALSFQLTAVLTEVPPAVTLNLALSAQECQSKGDMSSLDIRSRAILKEIIRVHVDTGQPVSSRTLFKSHRFDLSPASIRNIMADLTDGGYLAQPHTSAGRVPTDRAYRLYIDELMRNRRVGEGVRERVDSDLALAGPEVAGLFQAACRLLSRLSGEVGFVVAPDALHTVVKSLRFLSVAPGKVLVVQVNEPDVVLSRVLEIDGDYTPRELEQISERITREYAGKTLHEVRRRLLAEMAEEKAAADRMLRRALELAGRALDQKDGEERVFFEGASKLLDKPEFSDVDSLKRIFRAFDEKARLLDLVTRYLDSKETCVVLGSENSLVSDPRLSAVLTSYGSGETLTGMLGVIGPARREYPRVIPVVELLGRALTERLESREGRARREPVDG